MKPLSLTFILRWLLPALLLSACHLSPSLRNASKPENDPIETVIKGAGKPGARLVLNLSPDQLNSFAAVLKANGVSYYQIVQMDALGAVDADGNTVVILELEQQQGIESAVTQLTTQGMASSRDSEVGITALPNDPNYLTGSYPQSGNFGLIDAGGA